MIILIRSNDANPDPRLQKYINYLELYNIEYKVIAWNRECNLIDRKNFIYFNKKSQFGLGYRNITNKLSWFLFIINQLYKNKKDYKVIHACDLDTMIPSYISKIILKKKIIFDVFDWISQDEGKGFILKMLSYIENTLFRKADYAILCEEYRIKQVKKKYRRNYLVLPNIPDIEFRNDNEVQQIIEEQRTNYKFVLCYVGVFDSNRGLEDILNFVSKHPNFIINIGGFGKLKNLVLEKSRAYENIIYWGKVDYNKGLNIMKHSDIILAFYYLSNPVHKYAAPNKYYESLFLGKPILTNKYTELATKIMSYNTGIVIDEGLEAINNFFENVYKTVDLETIGMNASVVWDEIYLNYTQDFMEKEYSKIIEVV